MIKAERVKVLTQGIGTSIMAEKNSDAIRGISNRIMKMMELISEEYEMGSIAKVEESIGKKTRMTFNKNGGDADKGYRWGTYNANVRNRVYTGGEDLEYSSSSDGENEKTENLFVEGTSSGRTEAGER